MLTRDGYFTRDIKISIAMDKEAFNRKISLLTSKLNNELTLKLIRFCLEHCIIWLRNLNTKKTGAEVFGELRNVVLEENGKDKRVRENN